jgi:hypothetical protein
MKDQTLLKIHGANGRLIVRLEDEEEGGIKVPVDDDFVSPCIDCMCFVSLVTH